MDRSADLFISRVVLIGTTAMLALAVISYLIVGYSLGFLIFWIGSLLGITYFSYLKTPKVTFKFPNLNRTDGLVLVAITFIFALLYLLKPYEFPYQMNSDEIVIRNQIRFVCQTPNFNPLGPSTYFAFPVFVHALMGNFAKLLGGITVEHLRTVHATFGVTCLGLSYIFFRTLDLDRRLAIAATGIFGFNHSFLAISRMVSQNTTSPLIEMLSLSILFRALLSRSTFLMCIGGIAAGASFYVHPPARIIYFLFLLASRLICRSGWREWIRVILPSVIAFSITIFPMVWALHELPSKDLWYQRGQILLLPEGRRLERLQVFAKTDTEGVLTNIRHGLLAFNWPIRDYSNIYINRGFGFVDPVTGLMIWIGLAYLFRMRKLRSDHREADTLCSCSFLFLWLLFTFCITFAPSYTRLTIVLPFVAYLAAHGLVYTANLAGLLPGFIDSRLSRPMRAPAMPNSVSSSSPDLVPEKRSFLHRKAAPTTITRFSFAALCLSIVVLNFQSLWKFSNEANELGDSVSTSFRMAEQIANKPDWHVIISANNSEYSYYYYRADTHGLWLEYMDDNDLRDRLSVVDPPQLKSELEDGNSPKLIETPFVLFLNQTLWSDIRTQFQRRYPLFEVKPVMPDGSLLSVTVSNPAQK